MRYAFIIYLFVSGSLYAQAGSDTTQVVYFNSYFEAEKDINYVLFYGIPRKIRKNRFEVTFYTLNGQKVAMGEYLGRSLKNRSGVFVRFNAGGKIVVSTTFHKSIAHGTYMRFYDNGQIADSGRIKRGNNFNTWKSWHPNGQLKEIRTYKIARFARNLAPITDGEYHSWFANGITKDSGLYKNNQREGVWMEYIEEGRVRSVGQYKNNWKKGDWKYFDNKGKLLYLRRFNKLRYDATGERIEIRK